MGNILGRAIAGLLVSSCIFGAAYALREFAIVALSAPTGASPPFLVGPFATAALLAAFFALTVLILIGRPIYLVLRDNPQWYIAAVVGLVVGFAIDFALAFTFVAAGSDSGGIFGRLAGLLITSAQVGVLGGISGLAFWLIARPGRTA